MTEYVCSFYKKGYRNLQEKVVLQTKPAGLLTLKQVRDYIVSDTAKQATEELRNLQNPDKAPEYKVLNFEIVTFAGVFRYRSADQIAAPNGLMVIDIDYLESEDEARTVQSSLIEDPRLTVVLSFISPRGRGVKCVLLIDQTKGLEFKQYFDWVYCHILFKYGIAIDRSGSDISRACFLPYDPNCYYNTTLIENNNK